MELFQMRWYGLQIRPKMNFGTVLLAGLSSCWTKHWT